MSQTATLQSFLAEAGERVSQARSGLLVMSQSEGPLPDLSRYVTDFAAFAEAARGFDQHAVADELARFAASVKMVDTGTAEVYTALDRLSAAEAALLSISFNGNELIEDVSTFVDTSFDVLDARIAEEPDPDIDAEMLEIFRSEADELLAAITHNLGMLSCAPDNAAALWEIRRNAHTFKGAAGIVGLTRASTLAHRLEDLLDKMVEAGAGANNETIDLISRSNSALISMLGGTDAVNEPDETEFVRLVKQAAAGTQPEPVKAAPAAAQPSAETHNRPQPVVRIALDRLDELIDVSRRLIDNRGALMECFMTAQFTESEADFNNLEELLRTQFELTDELQTKLRRVRNVRFGTLETRLRRTVNLTCQDENKKADLELITPDVELDTQVIDALIEPLLHLLKNAVVHGIEPADTRRLIGKPERGTIAVSVQTDEKDVILIIEDDGSGISARALKEKAVANGTLSADEAAQMTEFEAWELIFNKGITTAEKVNLNAGRGIGMNIVRESIESRGGKISLSTEPQRGTTFTVRVPLSSAYSKPAEPIPAPPKRSTPLRVLVIDDSATVRRHNTALCEAAGCIVVTANNGAEALELLLNGNEFDLILSDVEMPHVDGWEFLEYVKSDANFGHVPVVMITSLSTEDHRELALSLRAEALLVKPLKEEDVAGLLKNVLAKAA